MWPDPSWPVFIPWKCYHDHVSIASEVSPCPFRILPLCSRQPLNGFLLREYSWHFFNFMQMKCYSRQPLSSAFLHSACLFGYPFQLLVAGRNCLSFFYSWEVSILRNMLQCIYAPVWEPLRCFYLSIYKHSHKMYRMHIGFHFSWVNTLEWVLIAESESRCIYHFLERNC